jgi:hypothetical protein
VIVQASPTFTAVGTAVVVWLITVVGAYLMQRRSYRGPAEMLLRRLTYGLADLRRFVRLSHEIHSVVDVSATRGDRLDHCTCQSSTSSQ